MSVIERKVKAIIEDKLGVDEAEITFDVTFEQLGADSLDCVELLMEVEKEFGISISDEEADRMETVGDAIEYIAVKTQSDERDSKSETTHDYEKEILDEISKKTGRQVRKSERWRNFLYAGGLIQTLNDRYGIEMTISDDSLKRADTIGELVSLINSTLQDVITKRDNRPPVSENDIITMISSVLGKEVNRGTSLQVAGLDIHSYIMLKNALNEKYGLSLEKPFFSFKNIGQIIDSIKEQDLKYKGTHTNEVDYIGQQIDLPTTKSESTTKGESTDLSNDDIETDIDTVVSKKYEWAITPDKTKHQYVIGIDFGHGETSAAYCAIGWESTKGQLGAVKDIDFGSNTKVIPSAISITKDGRAYIGDAAFLPEVLNKANVNVCFKKKPESLEGKSEQLMIRFMKEVYKTIVERNSALFPEGNHLVYIATPSGWEEKDQNLYGQMAAMAGLPMGGITSESRAAFIKAQQDPDSGLPLYIDKGAIVFDMGSSTLDFTYLTRDNKKPIDWGDNCGASKVERLIYESKREGNDEIIEFEKKYPNLVDALLFEARKAKEKVYFHPDMPCNISVNFETIVDGDEEFEDTKLKFKFKANDPDDEQKKKGYISLNKFLEEKGYIGTIRDAMMTFKNEKIAGKPIHVAFLTGGASRMDFIKELVKECWGLPYDRIYRDQDPSLTISQGVAVLGRGDIRSGGAQNTKYLLEEITANINDIYTPFAEILTQKVAEEMKASVVHAFIEFRDCSVDISLNDLQDRIGQWIESDKNNIGDWATECYQNVFEEKTADIRAKLDSIVCEFSNTGLQMGRVGSVNLTLPNLDLRDISEQMNEIGAEFAAEAGSFTEGVANAAIDGAIGFGLGMLIGGPLAWILAGGYFVAKYLFGEEESEYEKKRKAMEKDLDSSARLQVFNAFFDETKGKWDEVAQSIENTVHRAISGNISLKSKINEQSSKVIREYAQECINQTRSMLD